MTSVEPGRRARRRRTAWWNSQRFRSGAFVAGVAVVLWAKPMGLLLWARLRILANIPRTAIADDETFAVAPTNSLPPLEATDDSPVVVLPRAPSRNPFAISPGSPEATPGDRQQRDRPHSSTPSRTSNPADGIDEGKSSKETSDEDRSEHSDGASAANVP